MPYEGDELTECGVLLLDFKKIAVVAVSGSGPNVCGHLIIYTPAHGGYYFHVAGLYGVPRYMSAANFPRYLKENGKRELRRVSLVLPDPEGASAYIEEALATDWAWGVLPHNCVSFCEEVIRAGGGVWASYTNCPALATDVPQHVFGQFLNDLDTQIYRLYGVPR